MAQKSLKDTPQVYAWACLDSPRALSSRLGKLCVSHTLRIGRHTTLHDLGKEQPLWVHVADTLRFDSDAINFVCLSKAELDLTNLQTFDNLKAALKKPISVLPSYSDLDAMGWIDLIAKPSTLNNIQTLVYKINPYDLRKQIQSLILRYLKSEISVASAVSQLKSNLKTQSMVPLLKECLPLRNAVSKARNGDIEKVSLETGVPEFDILYILKSR